MALPLPLSESAARVFRVLVSQGPATRPELSASVNLSKQTVSLAIAELETRELVEAVSTSQGTVGRSAVRYGLARRAGWVAGADIGGSRLRVAATRLDGAILGTRTVWNPRPTPQRDWPDAVDFAAHALADLVSHVDEAEGGLLGIALGVPRPVAKVWEVVGERSAESDERLLAPLAPVAPAAVWVENNVNCAAIPQAKRTTSPSMPALYLQTGVGVGAALIVDGTVVRGARGRAGEVRSLPLGGYGDAITVESALGAVGLLTSAGRTPAGDLSVQIDQLFRDYQSGDERVSAALNRHALGTAQLIQMLAAMTDPERIVLSGVIGSHQELHPLVNACLSELSEDLNVVTDPLGTMATAIGAAALASERIIAALTSS